ncbi:PAS domain-containing protein, partial [archaeon]
MILLTIILFGVFLQAEFEDDAPYLKQRLLTRIGVLIIIVFAVILYLVRFCISSNVQNIARGIIYVMVSMLANWRLLYDVNYLTYVRRYAIWEFGHKMLFACFDQHFVRLAVFNVIDTLISSGMSIFIRAGTEEFPYRWVAFTLIWFTVFPFMTELSMRHTFARKCDLYIARMIAEEVTRLHRFVLNSTRDMVIVHGMDASASVLYVSRACGSMLGYHQRDLLHRSLVELVHPQDVWKARVL